MPLVEVNSVSKSYPRRMGLRTTEQTVVDNVSLTISVGEAEALCAHPREAYTRQLIAATPELPAGVA